MAPAVRGLKTLVWQSESARVSPRCSFAPGWGLACRRSRCSDGAEGWGSQAERKRGGSGRALPGPGASVRSPAGPPCCSSSAASGGGGSGGKGSDTAEVRRTWPGSATLVRWGGSHLPTRFSSFGAGLRAGLASGSLVPGGAAGSPAACQEAAVPSCPGSGRAGARARSVPCDGAVSSCCSEITRISIWGSSRLNLSRENKWKKVVSSKFIVSYAVHTYLKGE